MSAPPPYTDATGNDPGKYPQAPYPAQPAYPQQAYPSQPVTAQPAVGGQQGQQSTVVVMAPTVAVAVGEVPITTTCTNCQRQVVTNVSYETGALAWLICAVLCFVGCWPCACIPFCVDDCKDVMHTCPSCGFVLGRHRRL